MSSKRHFPSIGKRRKIAQLRGGAWGGKVEKEDGKKTYLIPNKHPSPIFILNQFPYFSIGEVHSEVEIAHPKL